MFTKESLLSAKLKVEEVKQNGLAFCCVRELTTAERATFNKKWIEIADDEEIDAEDVFHAFVACACVCDADGNRLFSYDDIDSANSIGYVRTLLIKEAADKINYFTADASEELKKN